MNKRAAATLIVDGKEGVFPARFGPAGASQAPARVPASASSAAKAGEVRVFRGDIQYVGTDGITRTLTTNGDNDEPVLSPDGTTVAFIHVDRRPRPSEDGDGDGGATSLWIADVANRTSRRLLASRPDKEEKRNLATFQAPRFSLDGGFVYIDADAWVTSLAIHQVNVKTGVERFVTDGSTLGVIRNGPHRGYLLVVQHRYYEGGGSYNPISVIRPDGTPVLVVPGTERDGDNDSSLEAWLKRNGWQAW